MATFISVSGPTYTGKTSLMNSLRNYHELQLAVLSPDIREVTSSEILDKGHFSEFKEIISDSEYLCIYIFKVIDYYNKYIESLKDSDVLVILDGCWLDIAIYSTLNMWYNREIRTVQEEILDKVSRYDSNISRIYLTRADDANYPISKYSLRGRNPSFRVNRSLEIRYYEMAQHLSVAQQLPSSDISESSMFIINDLKNLGYL